MHMLLLRSEGLAICILDWDFLRTDLITVHEAAPIEGFVVNPSQGDAVGLFGRRY